MVAFPCSNRSNYLGKITRVAMADFATRKKT
jgi:hypothetical protein